MLLAQATRVPPLNLSAFALSSKLFSSASVIKIFACSAKHDTCANPLSRGTSTRAPGTSFVFQWSAWVQM